MKPFDLQVNGYAGTDFCSATLTGEELHRACEYLRTDGVDQVLFTVITDSISALVAKLCNLVELRDADSLARQIIAGVHIEGPFLNPAPGYIGAHPPDVVAPATVDDAARLLEAANGLVRLVTLAPECDSGFATTRFLVEQGITVAAGHCNPSLGQLRRAVDSGLSMVTHFGNGCPVQLPRHDNVMQRFLACRDQLWFSFIPDGAHVDFFALRNYLDIIGLDRTIMVTDAISAARLGSGQHVISGFTVDVDQNGIARRPGSPNLAGSTVTMPRIREYLADQLSFTTEQIQHVIDTNPRRALVERP